jgi:two-component system, NtrC family, response regulator HydG
MRNILIIDDDKDFRFLIKRQLTESGFTCFEASTRDRAFEVLGSEPVDLVLCDLNLRKESGKDILVQMTEEHPNIPLIIITGYSNVRTAVELIKLGAVDYLLKPLIPKELVFIINSRIEAAKGIKSVAPKKTTEEPATRPKSSSYVFSDSKFLQQTLEQIKLVGPTNYSVIIYGESGSGKEAFAQEIHRQSKRKSKPFLAIDCGALSRELSASILFGHEKGAFTGAIGEKEGAFEHAQGGTVFLDEITNLPYEIQVSLLRVMQERKTRRVGGTVDIPIDVRIIVASNKKLWEACKSGEFREDLYHRFNEFTIDVKPLRERKEDIAFYANYFLQQSNAELNKNVTGFTEQAMEAFMQYSWPGNLRELRNLVRRSVLITETDTVGVDILPHEFFPLEASLIVPEGLQQKINNCFSTPAEADYLAIVEALQKTGFDKKKASRILQMDQKTLNKKIKTFADLYGPRSHSKYNEK